MRLLGSLSVDGWIWKRVLLSTERELTVAEIDDDDEETPAAADAATTEQIAAPEGKEDIGAVDSIPPVAATPVETA